MFYTTYWLSMAQISRTVVKIIPILHLTILPSTDLTSTFFPELDVSKNVLTDIPDTIKQCKQLAILDASVNPLQKNPGEGLVLAIIQLSSMLRILSQSLKQWVEVKRLIQLF